MLDDPYQRQWAKAWTTWLEDPKAHQLTWEQQGIWWSALLYSLKVSWPPGLFQTREHEPLDTQAIAYALRAPQSLVDDAFQMFRRLKLMTFDPNEGWAVVNWDRWQHKALSETREAQRERKRLQRARERDAQRGQLRRVQ